MAYQEATCPACGVRLVDRRAGSAAVRFCEKCEGIWVDAPTFAELAPRHAQQPFSEDEWLPSKKSKTAPVAKVRYWPCAVCGDFMNRVNFAHVSGVILDALVAALRARQPAK